MSFVQYYTYDLVLKHNFYIILRPHPGHLNSWTELIMAQANGKILETILKSSV